MVHIFYIISVGSGNAYIYYSQESFIMEVWRDITEFKGLYQVSNYGRVRSLSRMVSFGNQSRTVKERILKPKKHTGGYQVVNLQGKYRYIHRLVAMEFLENPNNYSQVNHKDEDKTNNHISNLEWCTHYYNNTYGTRNERMLDTKKQRKKTRYDLYSFDKVYIKSFSSKKEVAEFLQISENVVIDRIRRNNGFLPNHIIANHNEDILNKLPNYQQATKQYNPNLARNKKKLYVYDSQGKLVNTYDSMADFAREQDMDYETVRSAMRYRNGKVNNYILKREKSD